MRSLLIIIIPIFTLISCAQQGSSIKPQGEFSKIKVEPSFSLTKKIIRGDIASANLVSKSPGDYNPPALAAAANTLLKSNPDRAMYLFYLGQLRARSDANKSLDNSAKAGVAILNQKFGPKINQYAFKDISKLKTTVNKVINDDSSIPRNYDPKWIALHGMDAFKRTSIRFEPKSQWKNINTKTRNEYYAGFKSALGI